MLVNSNPATIMTDPDVADHVYIEPMTLEVVERILDIEKPDSVLPNLGGHEFGVRIENSGTFWERREIGLVNRRGLFQRET